MSRFALLRELSNQTSSEERRELLRNVTDALTVGPGASDEEVAELDQMLALVTREFSSQVRKDLARLVAAGGTRFSSAAEELALDEIAVAEPVLRHSPALSESTLLKVVNNTSQQHMMLVSRRHDITHRVSHALVEKGDEHVVSSLLENERAPIAATTYDAIAERADHYEALQSRLVRRKGVPLDILSGLYLKVEGELRQEILSQFGDVPESDLNAAFARSRTRVTRIYREVPKDFAAARNRVEDLRLQGKLLSPVLMTLLREGPDSRTAFEIAFSELADVDYEVVQRTVEGPDLDA